MSYRTLAVEACAGQGSALRKPDAEGAEALPHIEKLEMDRAL